MAVFLFDSCCLFCFHCCFLVCFLVFIAALVCFLVFIAALVFLFLLLFSCFHCCFLVCFLFSLMFCCLLDYGGDSQESPGVGIMPCSEQATGLGDDQQWSGEVPEELE